jgi:DNA polymerase I-like protein with 3'-5' exonuclease and polymerase domains
MLKPYFIGFDLETSGDKREYALQPYRLTKGQACITSFAAVDEFGTVISRGLNPSFDDLSRCLESIAKDPCAIVVGWNTKFDVAWLIALGLEDVVRRIVWLDGLILRRGLENNVGHSGWGLKATVAKYLPDCAGYEAEVGGRWDEVNDVLLEYNTLDSKYTAQLARIMWDLIEERPRRLVQVICQCIPAFARSWLDGVPMSRKALTAWGVQCDEQAAHALTQTTLDPKVIRSPKMLLEVLTEKGFEIVSTAKSQLSLHADHPEIAAIRAYKRATGSKTRYIQKSFDALDYHGGDTVHPDPNMWATYTGRGTYSSKQKGERQSKSKKAASMVGCQIQVGVSLHQWPKKREGTIARRCIVAPAGYLLAEYDFSNQESRVLAHLSQDPMMLSVFNEGRDFHCIMGAKAANQTYDEFYAWYKTGDKAAETFRQMGKVANLSLAYRTGALTFQTMARTDYDVILSFEEATILCQLFKRTYPKVVDYWSRAIQIARAHGYAESCGGRRVYLDQWSRGAGGYASEQTAINFPVQATGADMKFLAIALADAFLQKRRSRFMLELHDALFCIIPDDKDAMQTARDTLKLLNNLPYQRVYGWTPLVPLPVDGKIGSSWGDLETIK